MCAFGSTGVHSKHCRGILCRRWRGEMKKKQRKKSQIKAISERPSNTFSSLGSGPEIKGEKMTGKVNLIGCNTSNAYP